MITFADRALFEPEYHVSAGVDHYVTSAGDPFMPVRRSTLFRPLVIVAAVVASSLPAIAQQPPTPSRVRGTIEGVEGDVLAVKSRSGEDFKLHMASDMRVVGIVKISLSDIKVGSFIGTTTVPGPDGGANAIEVHVFPENMRGTGEGSRPFDLRPNSTMTNATVAESVAGNDGHTLLVKYKDGEKKVVVSPDTPVVTYVPADRSELKAGAKVIAFFKKLPEGSFEANRISVGLNGLTPPM
jgi:hypothetical protein